MKSGLLRNKKGVSIIQVLMAAGMTSIVSLGIVTMIENSRRMQRRTTMVSALNDIRSRFETNFRDQIAFNNTINGNSTAPWTQMKNYSNVTVTGLSTPEKFVLYDPANTPLSFLGVAASDSGVTRYAGYTERGGLCYDFNPVLGQGSDNCPISYRLLVAAECPKLGDTSCKEPQLRMVARLVFNPSNGTGSALNNWRGLIPTVAGSSLVNASEKYDAEVRRTPTTINKAFMISASVSPTGATTDCFTAAVTNTGGGQCSVGSYALHPLTVQHVEAPGWEKDSDAHSLVTVFTTGNFRFTTPGTYRCVATARAFGTNVTIGLFDATSSTTIPIGTGTAVLGTYSEGDARLDVTVNVTNVAHNYQLRQQCESISMKSCSLGFAKGPVYASDTMRLVTLQCDRMDVMF